MQMPSAHGNLGVPAQAQEKWLRDCAVVAMEATAAGDAVDEINGH